MSKVASKQTKARKGEAPLANVPGPCYVKDCLRTWVVLLACRMLAECVRAVVASEIQAVLTRRMIWSKQERYNQLTMESSEQSKRQRRCRGANQMGPHPLPALASLNASVDVPLGTFSWLMLEWCGVCGERALGRRPPRR